MNTKTTTPKTPGARTKPARAAPEAELVAYEQLRREVRNIRPQALDAVSAEAITKAVEEASRRLHAAGEHTEEAIAQATKALKKDLASASKTAGPRWEEFVDKTGGIFDAWRDKGGHIVALAIKALGEWNQLFGDKLDAMLVYHSGEATHGGTFVRSGCGHALPLKKPGHLRPCPKYHKNAFRRAQAPTRPADAEG